jgi:hypothetical protein
VYGFRDAASVAARAYRCFSRRLRSTSWSRPTHKCPITGIDAGAYFAVITTTTAGSLVALGAIDDLASGAQVGFAAWQSTDGATWVRADEGVDADFFLRDLASGPKGVALIGSRFSATDAATEIWFSTDGASWIRAFTVTITDELPAVFVDIGAGQDGFVATGYLGPGSNPKPFIVASGDGVNWVEAPSQPAIEEMGTGGQVGPNGGDWVVAGQGLGQIPIWRSVNGLNWDRVATIDTSAAESGRVSAYEVLEAGQGTLVSVVGCCTIMPPPIGAWASSDGSNWVVADFREDAVLRGSGANTVTEIVVGNLAVSEARAAIWASPSSD